MHAMSDSFTRPVISKLTTITKAQRRHLQNQQRAAKVVCSMSSAVTTVLLVRHGETAWNLQHRLQGQCEEDPPLNATGKQQAQALAERLSTEPVAAIYCSDLQRTVQTAQTVSDKLQGHQIVPVKELRERHLGVLEGLTRSQAALQYPNDFANLSGAPGAKPQARCIGWQTCETLLVGEPASSCRASGVL
ncbi:hypothetical protein ABBQ32_008150 [Trebouxia sp. C0010 RCD-2024]